VLAQSEREEKEKCSASSHDLRNPLSIIIPSQRLRLEENLDLVAKDGD